MIPFESFVNSEECKTGTLAVFQNHLFESFVNSEECKTFTEAVTYYECLRALLIQKSVKRVKDESAPSNV